MHYTDLTENEMISRAQAGDAAAFDHIAEKYETRVSALAYRMLGNIEDAADIRQEAFLLAWRDLRSFRGQASFSTWLYRIVSNLCLSMRRRKSWSAVSVPLDERMPDTRESAFPAEDAILVREALSAISERDRRLLVLREVEGRSCREISEAMGYSSVGVRARLSRARKALRRQLAPHWQM